jgi:hypothetical protein|tara:strand:- start:42 stop:533 length:492 start_codon:yes stop_codon:yes gene_type:complete
MIVDLKWYEFFSAACTGILRKSQSIAMEHKDAYGAVFNPVNDVGWQVVSAASEMACARALKRYYSHPVNTFNAPDIEPNYEVKCQMHKTVDSSKKENYLIMRNNMNDSYYYVLVLCHSLTRYEVVGYTLGADGKRQEWQRQVGNRPPFFAVPILSLTPIEVIQ